MEQVITDLTGHTFGSMTVLSFSHESRRYQRHYLCRCECGVERTYKESYLKAGKVSCTGCRRLRPKVRAPRVRNTKSRALGYRMYRYGGKPGDLDVLLAEQNGQCAICATVFEGPKSFHVDHDHVTGEVRGLLCPPCNVGLGLFKESKENLLAAIRYVERDPPHA